MIRDAIGAVALGVLLLAMLWITAGLG